jgi:hypothetical protein
MARGLRSCRSMSEDPSNLTGQAYLEVLDALVRRDPRPAGLIGRLSIGVREPQGDSWWNVSLGATPKTEFARCPSLSADSILLIGADVALRILQGQPVLPSGDIRYTGDRRLLAKFFSRYASYDNAISIRSRGHA